MIIVQGLNGNKKFVFFTCCEDCQRSLKSSNIRLSAKKIKLHECKSSEGSDQRSQQRYSSLFTLRSKLSSSAYQTRWKHKLCCLFHARDMMLV